MSSSDSAQFEELKQKVAKLETAVADLVEKVFGKDMMEEIYAGSTHAEDPGKRGPGRPPRAG